jgi:hypothetical protein
MSGLTANHARGQSAAPGDGFQNGSAHPGTKVEEDKIPLLEDIMQLARLGDVGAVQALFDSGKVAPSYRDGEGITPLHVSLVTWFCIYRGLIKSSGPPSTTTTQCAIT